MTMPLNECQFRAASPGLGNFNVNTAIVGFFTPAQCTNPVVVDGGLYFWRAENDAQTEHELFQGTYSSIGPTVARTTILQSSNGGAKVNFSSAPRVRMVQPSQAASRAILSANTTYFIRTTGSDITGNGSAGAPWATLQHAMNVLSSTIDGGDNNVTFDVGVGSFSGMGFTDVPGLKGLFLTGASRATTIITQGVGLPSDINVGESLAIGVALSYYVELTALTLAPTVATPPARACLAALSAQTVGVQDVALIIPDNFEGIHCETAAAVFVNQAIYVSALGAGAKSIFGADNLGYIEVSGPINLVGNPAFTNGTVNSARNGEVEFETTSSFSGTATGSRFNVTSNALIETFDRGLTFIPGSSAGVLAGGMYR